MGNIKDIGDILKDSLKGISTRKKAMRLLENMLFAINTNTVSDLFPEKFRKLEELMSIVKWKKKDKEMQKNYEAVRRYYRGHLFRGKFMLR